MFAKIYRTLINAGEILHKHWVRSPIITSPKNGHLEISADIEVNNFLTKSLQDNFSVPVVSEESVVDWEQRQLYKDFWLIDPLNGTREFMNRYGDFSICIALIRNRQPIFSVVYAPALDMMFYAGQAMGAALYSKGKKSVIEPAKKVTNAIMINRFHADDKVTNFCNRNAIKDACVAGGALKYCYLAMGRGSVYIQYDSIKEWDVASGDLILRESKGSLVSIDTKENIKYNNQDMFVPPFIATALGVDLSSFVP